MFQVHTCVLHLTNLLLTITLRVWICYHLHFTDQETAQGYLEFDQIQTISGDARIRI